MASDSYPRPGNNSGIVTELMYERLASLEAADGVLGHPGDTAPVYADGVGTRTVRVRANRRARVRGFMYDSGPEDVNVQLPANTSGTTRVDLIVARLDRATWRVQETYIQGTPGQGAPAPVRQVTSGVYDLPLAKVTVAHNATALAPGTVAVACWYVGTDGQIRCTPDTRPPHEAGRVVWDTVNGYLVSTGGRWLLGVEDSGLTALAMLNNFAANENHVQRRNGWAFADLTFRRPTAGMNGGTAYTIARLPDGFRPPFTYQTNAQCPSAQVTVTVAVREDGYINVNPGADIPANRAVVLDALNHPVA
ncbi:MULTISPECIES: hypothetical protein [unclassified Micromonospora]|uniref:hypothetical protein n=1 Tax=unclassified Micromonospora TaxID=2617518 RepID=UPI0033346201